jgi:hypothetical protein
VSPLLHATCDAIVAIFETGHLPTPEAYSTATLLADGAGVSYGRAQATLSSLQAILDAYAIAGGAYAGEIRRVLAGHRLEDARVYRSEDGAASWVVDLLAVLRQAGTDTVMRQAQDDVFSRAYFQPSVAYALTIGCELPLSVLAIYDTAIQSGLSRVDVLRQSFAALPPSRGGGERTWTLKVLLARRDWLSSFISADAARQRLVRSTVYRVQALLELAQQGRWELDRPLVVRGITIP